MLTRRGGYIYLRKKRVVLFLKSCPLVLVVKF